MDSLKGKKLLILGCTRDDCEIVETAKRMGIYVIVTDNHKDWSLAPAKTIADEAWDISWSDIETLKEKCINEKVDGVMAGYSEFRTNMAVKLSRAIGTHFYIENEQMLKMTRDKKLFKDICTKFGVPVPREYEIDLNHFEESLEKVEFPVIVKPVDNGGSRGIRTCFKKEDLLDCINYAISFSETKRFLVEELLTGQEIIANFTMADGEIVVSTMCDKFERVVGKGANVLPDIYLYPSHRLELFLNSYMQSIIAMFHGIGLKNGFISLQGFAKKDGSLSFFEPCYRLGGTHTYLYSDAINGANHLKQLISFSLTGNMHPELLNREDPHFNGKYGCTLTLLIKGGTIASQKGQEEVNKMENVLYTCFYHRIGEKIVVDGSQVSQKAFRAYILAESIDEVKKTIHRIQNTVEIKDVRGENMLFEPFDTDLLDIYNH